MIDYTGYGFAQCSSRSRAFFAIRYSRENFQIIPNFIPHPAKKGNALRLRACKSRRVFEAFVYAV